MSPGIPWSGSGIAALNPRGPVAPPTAIRTLIVAETGFYAEALADTLEARPEVEVVGAIRDPAEALELLTAEAPTVVLCAAATGTGSSAVDRLAAAGADARIIAMGALQGEGDILALAESGVCAFVTQDATLDDLVRTIVAVATGDAGCTAHVARVLLGRVATVAAERTEIRRRALPRLTTRELEIVQLIGDGLSNKEIAGRLRIAIPTVKNHVHSVLDKLRVPRRSDAVARVRAEMVWVRD